MTASRTIGYGAFASIASCVAIAIYYSVKTKNPFALFQLI